MGFQKEKKMEGKAIILAQGLQSLADIASSIKSKNCRWCDPVDGFSMKMMAFDIVPPIIFVGGGALIGYLLYRKYRKRAEIGVMP